MRILDLISMNAFLRLVTMLMPTRAGQLQCVEHNAKLCMHIRTVSELHFSYIPQSNCPPIFISANVPCLHLNHFVRQNSVCFILNYLVFLSPMCSPNTQK